MSLEPHDYLDISRDPRRYRDLKRLLRESPEEERFRFIWEIIKERRGLGLRLANSCLRDRDLFERLLVECIRTSDPSSVRSWLRCIVPRLGVVRVLRAVEREMEAHPNFVDSSLYALPWLVKKWSRREAYAFARMKTIAEAIGLVRGPVMERLPDGSVKFKVIP